PITDPDDEPWVWRPKDFTGWWSHPHHNRIGGVRQATSTAWLPESKPIWFTALGCPAVDKAANQPARFLHPASADAVLP
ncbi:MAG: glycoside hydrolase TIM-barrel-like domain-containing protein, partial [Paracoccaceae bacterium]|nr:glycoside hydrolase TIM-barrel-like domain-containing protein [Paracoccaceae bacterium]